MAAFTWTSLPPITHSSCVLIIRRRVVGQFTINFLTVSAERLITAAHQLTSSSGGRDHAFRAALHGPASEVEKRSVLCMRFNIWLRSGHAPIAKSPVDSPRLYPITAVGFSSKYFMRPETTPPCATWPKIILSGSDIILSLASFSHPGDHEILCGIKQPGRSWVFNRRVFASIFRRLSGHCTPTPLPIEI